MLHLRLRTHLPLTKVVTRMSSTSIRTMVVLRTGTLAPPSEMEDNLFRAMLALRYPDKLRPVPLGRYATRTSSSSR